MTDKDKDLISALKTEGTERNSIPSAGKDLPAASLLAYPKNCDQSR